MDSQSVCFLTLPRLALALRAAPLCQEPLGPRALLPQQSLDTPWIWPAGKETASFISLIWPHVDKTNLQNFIQAGLCDLWVTASRDGLNICTERHWRQVERPVTGRVPMTVKQHSTGATHFTARPGTWVKFAPRVLQSFVKPLGHFLNGGVSLVGRQQVGLVQDDHHARAGELSDQQTLRRLRLDPLHNIHHQHHQVNDLSPCRRDQMQTAAKVMSTPGTAEKHHSHVTLNIFLRWFWLCIITRRWKNKTEPQTEESRRTTRKKY